MINAKEIPVIIPAYEPDEKMITLLKKLKEQDFKNIVVVDDGSGEAYGELFLQAQNEYDVKLLRHAQNQGKGRALKTAFNYCLNEFKDAPGAITADCDGQHSPDCIFRCAKALLENPNALILGCRSFEEDHVPGKSRFGNKITIQVMKYLTGISVSDTQTGLRAVSSDFMRILLQVRGERFEFETNMLLETKPLGIPIVEVPIETIYIEGNKSTHFNPVKDSIKIYAVFGKFLISSFSSSLVDLILFTLFCFLLRDKSWGAVTYIMAATYLARIISALYNYTLNHKVVFQSEQSMRNTLPRYIILAIVQMAISAFLVNLLYPLFGGAEVFVKIPVDVILFFLSYVIQREFVYNRKKGK